MVVVDVFIILAVDDSRPPGYCAAARRKPLTSPLLNHAQLLPLIRLSFEHCATNDCSTRALKRGQHPVHLL
jgi:hypothetical protein